MRAVKRLAAPLLCGLLAGCSLVLPRSSHEREPADPDVGRCSIDGCLPTSVCEAESDLCRDCWGPAGRLEVFVPEGTVAEGLSMAMRATEGEETELYLAYVEVPPSGARRPVLLRYVLGYSRVRAAFEPVDRAGVATPEVVELGGDFALAGEPLRFMVALDGRRTVGVLHQSAAGLAIGTVLHQTTGAAWSSRTLLFAGARPDGPIDAWPSPGPMVADVPWLWIGMLGHGTDGAPHALGVPPTETGDVYVRRLEQPADFIQVVGSTAYLGAEAAEELTLLDFTASGGTTTLPTPGRSGPIATVDDDGTCALLAWPRGPRVEVALADGPAGTCVSDEPEGFWPASAASEPVTGIELASSRVGTLALTLTTPGVGAPVARAFVLGRDGDLAWLAGRGTFGVELDGRDAVLAVSANAAATVTGEPSPWPFAIASFQPAAGAIGPKIVISLARGCDVGVE